MADFEKIAIKDEVRPLIYCKAKRNPVTGSLKFYANPDSSNLHLSQRFSSQVANGHRYVHRIQDSIIRISCSSKASESGVTISAR